MIGAIEGSGTADMVREQAGNITRTLTSGEEQNSDKAMKMLAAQTQIEVSANKIETAEDMLSVLLS